MKRILAGIILGILLLFAALIGTAVRPLLPETFSAKQMEPVTEWAAPDPDYLSAYGLDYFSTTLPVVYIDTGGQQVLKENKIWSTVAVLDREENGGEHSIISVPDYKEDALINYRGASSYSQFDKKQYRIKFYKKKGSGKPRDIAFLGMGKNSEWVLNGPYLDKTLVRNKLVYDLGRETMDWAPDTRFVELFVNGEYRGVYVATEPVTNGVSRLRLSTFGLLSGECAFVLKRDRVGTENRPLNNYGTTGGKTINELYISYPSEKDITDREYAWIEEHISKFERFLYAPDFPGAGSYRNYLDLDSFADYFILNEFAMNHDAGNLSTYPYAELSQGIQMALWDFNNAFDNYQWFYSPTDVFYLRENAWFDRLLLDREFVDLLNERYRELRETSLSEEHIFSLLDSYERELGGAIDRNFAVWGYTFELNLLNEQREDGSGRDLKSYEEAKKQLRDTIQSRLLFLDQHMTDLYDNVVN